MDMDITILAISLFVLYIIGLNSMGSLFGCGFRRVFQNNIYFRHLSTFGYILFISVYANQEFAASNFWSLFGYSFLLYVGFIMTTRIHYLMLVLVMALLLMVYILGIQANNSKDKEKEKLLQQQWYGVYAVGVAILVGFIHYFLKQIHDKKQRFTVMKFIFEDKCSK